MTSAPLLYDETRLAGHLAAGGAALFPTDTLPALAVRPQQAARLWELKVRPPDKPLILMGASLGQLQQLLALPWPDAWLRQSQRCWPGAVTLVLPLEGPLTTLLHPGGHSLGLRVPDCAAAQRLLARSGPLATSSANRSGEAPALDAAAAARQFPELPLLGPLPWPAGSGHASTVMAWQPSGSWQVLRAGAVMPGPPPSP
jgi:L-threonylcarbamoyladenylate synthase